MAVRSGSDALVHEFVHYLQSRYLKDDFSTNWSETEAVAVQTWFRREHMSRSSSWRR